MEAVSGGSGWTANRGEVGGVSMTVAPTLAAEASAMRDAIERLRSSGDRHGDQAILGRSHLTLGRVRRAGTSRCPLALSRRPF